MAFRERQLVIVVLDLARFTQAVAGMNSAEIAELVNRSYFEMTPRLTASGGRVVKYMGDGCLAVFDPERAVDAIDAVEAIGEAVRGIASELDIALDLGANLHVATVVEGEFGPEGSYDVMGPGTLHAFKMGAGGGVRISEPLYRKLPSERRSAWTKYQPPATYTLVAR